MFAIKFTDEEIEAALDFAKKRNAENTARGWTKTHYPGRDPVAATQIGELGEVVFARFLAAEGIPFNQTDRLVDRYHQIRHDVMVGRIRIGVKTTGYHPSRMESFGTYQYPRKNATHVLGYPDVVVFASVVLLTREGFLLATAGRKTIIQSPIKGEGRNQWHEIAREDVKELAELIGYLKRYGLTEEPMRVNSE